MIAVLGLAARTALGQRTELTGSAAVAEAVLWGAAMAPPDRTSDLPGEVQKPLVEYRTRERAFRTALTRSPNETADEREMFTRRVAMERVVFSLFPRRDVARVAATYASDAEISYEWEGRSDGPRLEAAFIDGLLRDLRQPWLAPYLNLIAGHRKLCASQLNGREPETERRAVAEAAYSQLARARDGRHPLIRVTAEHLLTTRRCVDR